MRRSVVTGRTLYEDPRLLLSTAAVTMRGYWPPFATSRTLRLESIARYSQHTRDDPSLRRWPRWGRGGAGTWFPLDRSRPRRDVAVALWHHDGARAVVTPANPVRFIALLGELDVAGGHPGPVDPADS